MRRALRVALLAAAVAGCGRSTPDEPSALSFEQLTDTSGLSRGRPLLAAFEPYRMPNGVVRVRGRLDLPDGARVQISVFRAGTTELAARVQVVVQRHRFDSPPMIGPRGPLPVDDYQFEALAFFDSTWQPPDVVAATGSGRRLRGPGITRGRHGQPAFVYQEERHL